MQGKKEGFESERRENEFEIKKKHEDV